MVTSCIAYGVGHMNGVLGLQAWRWLFIVEGAPTGLSTQYNDRAVLTAVQFSSASV